MKRYLQQYRGDGGAYDRYLAGMDASMRQKVALTAAHLLALGKVADMGMGSGTGSHTLAALYPALEVQACQLAARRVLVVRDFVDPGGEEVWLDLPADDGEAGVGDDPDDPLTCSTAALFERFWRQFRRLCETPASAS